MIIFVRLIFMSGQLCEQPRLIVGAWAGASHGAGAGLWTGSESELRTPAPDTGTGQEVGWGGGH